MKDLNEVTEHICDLKGIVIAANILMASLLRVLPPEALSLLKAEYDKQLEGMRTELLNAKISELTIDAFERDARSASTILQDRLTLLSL
jgi:hypothetical protein